MLLLGLLACDTGPNYGPFTTMIRAHRETLETRPCDATVNKELAIGLRDALAYEEALQVYRNYEANCEAREASVLLAHIELAQDQGNLDEAVGASQMLVDQEPENGVFVDQYVELVMKAGQPEKAIPFLQTAYWGNYKETDKLFTLAQAQEDAGLTCDAMASWTQLWWVSYEHRGDAAVGQQRLEERCPGVTLKEEGTVKQDPAEGYWRFDVGLNGHDTLLGLDSSAPLTYISTEVFKGIEGATLVREGVTMKAGTGILVGDVYKVETARVGTAEVKHIDVLVVPKVKAGLDGFLGTNLGGRMEMSEKTKRQWTLKPPE